MNYYEVTIPFERRNFDTTKAAKYRGDLTLYTNEFGIVYNWKINFKELWLDLYTTPSHVENRNGQFPAREVLFNMLGFEQEKRPSKSSQNLVWLNQEQLEITNSYFNDRDLYKKTIKQIVGTIKGNNPGGEFSRPGSAEMISSNPLVKNFTILLDDITVMSDADPDAYLATPISVEEFFGIHDTISKAFKFMQKEKTNDVFANYIASIKNYVEKYRADVNEIDREVQKARSEYGKLTALVKEKAFEGFNESIEGQKAHIYDVWRIKDNALLLKRSGQEWKPTIKLISDPNNYIPLPEFIHRTFDKERITYTSDGFMYAVNEAGLEFMKNYIKGENAKFGKINEKFMTKERIKYIVMRNENILF